MVIIKVQIKSEKNAELLALTMLPFEHKKITRNQDEKLDYEALMLPSATPLEEVKASLMLSYPICDNDPFCKMSIQSVASCFMVEDNVPTISSTSQWILSTDKCGNLSQPIIPNKMREADSILSQLKDLEPKKKNLILLQVNRLNGYNSSGNAVDRIIDLRICLESIFSGGEDKQIKWKVSLRAALFLGDTPEERKNIFNDVKKAYEIASNTIHTGKVPSNDLNTLETAGEVSRKAILKIIHNSGMPDWGELNKLKKEDLILEKGADISWC